MSHVHRHLEPLQPRAVMASRRVYPPPDFISLYHHHLVRSPSPFFSTRLIIAKTSPATRVPDQCICVRVPAMPCEYQSQSHHHQLRLLHLTL